MLRSRRPERLHGPRRFTAVLLFAGALQACDGTTTPTAPPEPDGPPLPGLSVAPSSAAPGQVLTLSGPGADSSSAGGLEGLSVEIGGEIAPLRTGTSGDLITVIPPSLVDPEGEPIPAGPVDVRLVRGGAPVALGEGAVAVLGMPDAPGATANFAASLDTLRQEMETVFQALGAEGTQEDAFATAVSGALDELLNGDAPGSLRSILADADPQELALVDRYIAASGILENTRAFVEQYQQLSVPAGNAAAAEAAGLRAGPDSGEPVEGPASAALTNPAFAPPPGATLVTDQTLARRMQFHQVASLFGSQVINATAETWANGWAIGFGAMGLVIDVPLADQVSAILSVIDFSVNKILVGLLPSEVETMELDLGGDRLDYDEATLAKVWVTARNTPPSVGIQDFVGLTLNLLGLGAGGSAESFRDVLEQTAAFWLSTIQQGLSTYSSAHPELNLDVSFSLVPSWTFASLVEDPRLVEPVTLTPEIVSPVEGEVNWQAGSVAGEGRVYARVSTAPEAILIDLPSGFPYTGGAFGESVLATETQSLFVQGPLAVEIQEAPSTLEQGEIGTLIVRAGIEQPDSAQWVEGIGVEVLVDGGTVQDSTGVTDADGQFITSIQMGPESEGMILSITVTNEFDESETISVEVGLPQTGDIVWLENLSRARASASATAFGATDSDFFEDNAGEGDFDGGTLTAAASATAIEGGASASSGGSGTLEWSVRTQGSVVTLAGRGSAGSVSEVSGGAEGVDAQASGSMRLRMVVRISGETTFRIVASSASGSGRRDLDIVVASLDADGDTVERFLDVSLGESEASAEIDLTGVLPPGTYELSFDGGAGSSVGEYEDGIDTDGHEWDVSFVLGGS